MVMTAVEDRFWALVDIQSIDDCWEWLGTRNIKGYGSFYSDLPESVASRVAWLLTNGPISPGMLVCHRCDNPPCVSPYHLFLGTASDNQRDSVEKGRHVNTKKTKCPAGHEYSEQNTAMVEGKRICIICRKTNYNRWAKENGVDVGSGKGSVKRNQTECLRGHLLPPAKKGRKRQCLICVNDLRRERRRRR